MQLLLNLNWIRDHHQILELLQRALLQNHGHSPLALHRAAVQRPQRSPLAASVITSV